MDCHALWCIYLNTYDDNGFGTQTLNKITESESFRVYGVYFFFCQTVKMVEILNFFWIHTIIKQWSNLFDMRSVKLVLKKYRRKQILVLWISHFKCLCYLSILIIHFQFTLTFFLSQNRSQSYVYLYVLYWRIQNKSNHKTVRTKISNR